MPISTLGSGALIRSVTAGKSGDYGDVSIIAQGSLLQSGTGTNVSGLGITLTTTIGSIGTIANPLVIAAHGTALANGGFSGGLVTADAPGDVGLEQVGGDLIVNFIRSEVGQRLRGRADGAIYDLRSMTPAQLLSESDAQALWPRLGLNGSVSTLTQGTITAFQNQVDHDYQQYWNLMDEGSVSAGIFTLSSAGLNLYRVQAAASLQQSTATDAQVQTYANSLYQSLNAFFTQTIGANFATTAAFVTFNPKYQYTVTSDQQNNLTKNAGWTTNELQYFVNATALQPAGSPIPPTEPNVFGDNVTLHASGGIGLLAAPVQISLSAIQNGTLTSAQAAALALAAAPGDVTVDGVDSKGNPVSLSFAGALTLPAGVTVTGIEVKQLAPFYVTATGSFNATSDKGVVFVQSTGSDLKVGSVSAATDASLISPQNILSAGTAAVQVQTGGNLTLLAGGGDIAGSDAGGILHALSHPGGRHAPFRPERHRCSISSRPRATCASSGSRPGVTPSSAFPTEA